MQRRQRIYDVHDEDVGGEDDEVHQKADAHEVAKPVVLEMNSVMKVPTKQMDAMTISGLVSPFWQNPVPFAENPPPFGRNPVPFAKVSVRVSVPASKGWQRARFCRLFRPLLLL